MTRCQMTLRVVKLDNGCLWSYLALIMWWRLLPLFRWKTGVQMLFSFKHSPSCQCFVKLWEKKKKGKERKKKKRHWKLGRLDLAKMWEMNLIFPYVHRSIYGTRVKNSFCLHAPQCSKYFDKQQKIEIICSGCNVRRRKIKSSKS